MPPTKPHRIDPETRARARELRRSQTPSEAKLWSMMRSRGLDGLKFRRQHPIGPFIADFCCPALKLVIEVDGGGHADKAVYDADRTAWLEAQGFRVLRFTNDEVQQNLEGVAEEILRAAGRIDG